MMIKERNCVFHAEIDAGSVIFKPPRGVHGNTGYIYMYIQVAAVGGISRASFEVADQGKRVRPVEVNQPGLYPRGTWSPPLVAGVRFQVVG